MSRTIDRKDPRSWSEEDVLYLHQYDEMPEEVKARADELGVSLPQPTPTGAAPRPEGGLSDYSVGALLEHLNARRLSDPDGFEEASEAFAASQAEVPDTYEAWTKTALAEEVTNRGLEYDSRATKAELISILAADDAGA